MRSIHDSRGILQEEIAEKTQDLQTLHNENQFLRKGLTAFAQTVEDEETMLELADLYPEWAAGSFFKGGSIVRFGINAAGQPQLYRIIPPDGVTGQAHQPPGGEGMLAVYRPIGTVDEEAGTIENPIPFVYGMDCIQGKYYAYEGKIYQCKLDMPACVWYPGSPGLWQWEEVV